MTNYVEKLDRLKPHFIARIVELKPELHMMLGYDCFSGSLKGLSAYGAVRKVLQEKGEEFFVGKTLLDASSGNFGRALAFIAEYLNLDCEVIISTKATGLTLVLIEAHGAKITIGGDTTRECYEHAKKLYENNPNKYVLIGQLDNWGNPDGHYQITAPSIFSQLPDVKNIFLSMGSGGGMYGIASYIHEHSYDTKVFATIAEPGHKIVGTLSKTDYVTPFITKARNDALISAEVQVTKQEAIENTILAINQYAVLVGVSTGGNLASYYRLLNEGKVKGKSLIIAYDSHDRWTDDLKR